MRVSDRRPSGRFRLSPIAAALACMLGAAGAQGATYTVSNNMDFSVGTLRDAITQVNANCPGPHTIQFSGAFTISLAAPLPKITCPNVTINGNGSTLQWSSFAVANAATSCGGIDGTVAAGIAVNNLSATDFKNWGYGLAYPFCGVLAIDGGKMFNNEKGAWLDAGSSIQNVEITGNVRGIYGAGITVKNATIHANTTAGIEMSGGSIEGGTIRNHAAGALGANVYTGTVVKGVTFHDNIEALYAGGGVTVLGSTFRTNTIGINASSSAVIGGTTAADRNYVYGNTTGIYLSYGGSILGNYIGTPDGIASNPNTVGISASGPVTVSNNLVSGNQVGIAVSGAAGASISNNLVGTNASGSAALGNTTAGIELDTTSGATLSGNVVSGQPIGIMVSDSSSITISGNKIGVDVTGTAGIANASTGLDASCGTNVTIENNVISSNGPLGAVRLRGMTSPVIRGNKIGTAADGVSALANNGPGVSIDSADCGPVGAAAPVEPSLAKLITGTSSAQVLQNVIAHNQGDGVKVVSGTGNRISDNSIHSNRDKNINLDFTGGPLPNDALDTDTGPNNRQNYPTITQAYHLSGTTTIQYELKSAASSTFQVELYANDPTAGAKPSGQSRIAGPLTVTTDATGTYTGTLTVTGTFDYLSALATDSAGNTSELSPIARAIAGPNASISPSTVSFGSIPVGATSPTSTITVLSTGGLPYQISSLVSSATASCTGTAICTGGDFACSTTCTAGTNYATNQSCTITASFSPNSVGAQSASLYICDNSGVGPRAISLSATGIVPTVSPGTFDFGSVSVGSSAPTKTFTLANSGVVAAPLGTIGATGDFAITTTTCGASLAPGGTCTFDVRFSPTATGTRTGQAGTSASFATVQGTGTLEASFTVPASLDLGAFLIGATPISQAVNITNTGNTGLVLGPFAITAPFQYANACPATLAPGAACSITVSFTSTASGTFTGTFTISSNATGGDRTITLAAQADVARIPAASIAPTTLAFGSVAVGEASSPGTVTITSNGTAPYQITSLVTSATPSCTGALPCAGSPFTCTTTCSTAVSYAPGASCQISATFQPATAGTHTTTVYVCDNASATPRAITLSGSGSLQPVTISPTAAEFGAILVGGQSVPRRFTVTNPGATEMPVSVTLTGDYAMSNGCGSAIAARSNCVVDVTFAPRQGGDRDGTLSVTDLRAAPAGGTPARGKVLGTATASLHGVGLLAAVLQLPGSVDLGTFVLGTTTPLRGTVTLRNTGNAMLTIDSVGVSGPFTLQNNCPVNLLPGASCDVVVTFLPASDGTFNGTLNVVSNAAGGSGAIPVIARAQPRPVPVIRVAPTSVGFGERMVGTTSASQRVTIRNDGAAPATLGAMQIAGDFVVSTTCGTTLEPQQGCVAEVSLRPTGFGPRGGELSFTSNAEGSPHTVSLVGTGCRPFGIGASRFGTRPSCAP